MTKPPRVEYTRSDGTTVRGTIIRAEMQQLRILMDGARYSQYYHPTRGLRIIRERD